MVRCILCCSVLLFFFLSLLPSPHPPRLFVFRSLQKSWSFLPRKYSQKYFVLCLLLRAIPFSRLHYLPIIQRIMSLSAPFSPPSEGGGPTRVNPILALPLSFYHGHGQYLYAAPQPSPPSEPSQAHPPPRQQQQQQQQQFHSPMQALSFHRDSVVSITQTKE